MILSDWIYLKWMKFCCIILPPLTLEDIQKIRVKIKMKSLKACISKYLKNYLSYSLKKGSPSPPTGSTLRIKYQQKITFLEEF